MYHIVYLAMNHIQFVKECVASVHSLHYKAKEESQKYHITIYTNLRGEFEQYKLEELFFIEYITISDSLQREWLDNTLYVYQLKIYVMIDFLQRKKQSFIFLDCDTFLIGDISVLFHTLCQHEDTVLMNYAEKSIKQLRQAKNGNHRHPHQEKFYYDMSDLNHLIVEEKIYGIKDDFSFWNSGVVGLNPQMEASLTDALMLNDYIFSHYQMLTSEQNALSIALSQQYRIVSTDHIVYHYWFIKEARYLIEAAFNLPVEIEKKHSLSLIAEMLQQRNKIEYETMEETLSYCLNKKDNILKKSLYEIIPSHTYLGRSIRNDV